MLTTFRLSSLVALLQKPGLANGGNPLKQAAKPGPGSETNYNSLLSLSLWH